MALYSSLSNTITVWLIVFLAQAKQNETLQLPFDSKAQILTSPPPSSSSITGFASKASAGPTNSRPEDVAIVLSSQWACRQWACPFLRHSCLPLPPWVSLSLCLPQPNLLYHSCFLASLTCTEKEELELATHEGAPAILNHTGLDSGYLYTSCRLYLRNRGREKSELTFLYLEFFKSICRLRRLSESVWVCERDRARTSSRMIAAQLLAYYFTELKDDQVKKVSVYLFPPFLILFVCLRYTKKTSL